MESLRLRAACSPSAERGREPMEPGRTSPLALRGADGGSRDRFSPRCARRWRRATFEQSASRSAHWRRTVSRRTFWAFFPYSSSAPRAVSGSPSYRVRGLGHRRHVEGSWERVPATADTRFADTRPARLCASFLGGFECLLGGTSVVENSTPLRGSAICLRVMAADGPSLRAEAAQRGRHAFGRPILARRRCLRGSVDGVAENVPGDARPSGCNRVVLITATRVLLSAHLMGERSGRRRPARLDRMSWAAWQRRHSTARPYTPPDTPLWFAGEAFRAVLDYVADASSSKGGARPDDHRGGGGGAPAGTLIVRPLRTQRRPARPRRKIEAHEVAMADERRHRHRRTRQPE